MIRSKGPTHAITHALLPEEKKTIPPSSLGEVIRGPPALVAEPLQPLPLLLPLGRRRRRRRPGQEPDHTQRAARGSEEHAPLARPAEPVDAAPQVEGSPPTLTGNWVKISKSQIFFENFKTLIISQI